jgi:exodeoxyribonuclease VII small subunit
MTNTGFEKALADLEDVVAKLEKGGTALNESLVLFEKGVKLARFLRAELDKAERKVEILLKDEKGAVHAEDFELGETGEEAKPKARARAKAHVKAGPEAEAEEGPEFPTDDDDAVEGGDKGGKLF